jgi:hypothetical protein
MSRPRRARQCSRAPRPWRPSRRTLPPRTRHRPRDRTGNRLSDPAADRVSGHENHSSAASAGRPLVPVIPAQASRKRGSSAYTTDARYRFSIAPSLVIRIYPVIPAISSSQRKRGPGLSTPERYPTIPLTQYPSSEKSGNPSRGKGGGRFADAQPLSTATRGISTGWRQNWHI